MKIKDILKNKELLTGLLIIGAILAIGISIHDSKFENSELTEITSHITSFQHKMIEVEKDKISSDDDYSPAQRKILIEKLDTIQENIKPNIIAKAVNEMRIKRTGEYPEIYLVFLYKNDIHVLELKRDAFIDPQK